MLFTDLLSRRFWPVLLVVLNCYSHKHRFLSPGNEFRLIDPVTTCQTDSAHPTRPLSMETPKWTNYKFTAFLTVKFVKNPKKSNFPKTKMLKNTKKYCFKKFC